MDRTESEMDRLIRGIGKTTGVLTAAVVGLSAIGASQELLGPANTPDIRRTPPVRVAAEMSRLPEVAPPVATRRLPPVEDANQDLEAETAAPAEPSTSVTSTRVAPTPARSTARNSTLTGASITRLPPISAPADLAIESTDEFSQVAFRQHQDAGRPEAGVPRPAMRRLPAVATQVLEAKPVPTLAMRRLPAVPESELVEVVPARIAPDFLDRWRKSGSALVSVAEQARLTVEHGYRLAEKGALYSARAEFIEALRGIAQGLDAHYGESAHTESLLEGVRALKEADDFVARRSSLEEPLKVSTIVATHRTRVPGVGGQESTVLAMQKYYQFGQDRLAAATGGSPVAAEALYGLGKVYMAFGERAGGASIPGPKSMAYLGAALQVNPQHAMAANELGVFYARLGKLLNARAVLQQSVASQPLPENLRNLAVVYRRLGDVPAEHDTVARLNVLQNRSTAVASNRVRWVAPGTFANSPGQSVRAASAAQQGLR